MDNTVNKIFRVKNPNVFKSKEKPVDCSFPELVVGLELETENANRDPHFYIDYSEKKGMLWNVDRDGSLRGGEAAYEFISRPTQLQHIIPELGAFLQFAKFNERNYSDRCSVHVHTNVTDFTQDMLASLALTYTVIEETLFQYVNHFKAPTKEGYCRDTNLYCIPWSQCRLNYKLIEGIFNPSQKKFAKWQKYTALNLVPITTQGTVEWRHMHGTADMEKLTRWLNVIGSIMRYAKRTPLDDVLKTIKTLNDTSAYRQFFTESVGGYLEYTDAYASTLSEGVVNAKYSLMDWDRSKVEKIEEKAPKIKTENDDVFTEPLAQLQARAEAREARDAQRRAVRAAIAGVQDRVVTPAPEAIEGFPQGDAAQDTLDRLRWVQARAAERQTLQPLDLNPAGEVPDPRVGQALRFRDDPITFAQAAERARIQVAIRENQQARVVNNHWVVQGTNQVGGRFDTGIQIIDDEGIF